MNRLSLERRDGVSKKSYRKTRSLILRVTNGRSVRYLAFLCVFGLAGCGDKVSAPPQLPGTYQLQSVDGSALPAIVVSDPANAYTLSLIRGSFTVNQNSTFSNQLRRLEVVSGIATESDVTCTGTYQATATGLLFAEVPGTNCGSEYSGHWDRGDFLTVDYDSQTQAIFRR